jgi:hypothetical protein
VWGIKLDVQTVVERYKTEAVALGERLGRAYGVPWETWHSDQPYVLEIYIQGEKQVETWAFKAFPMGQYWYQNHEKLGWRLSILGFIAPMAVASIIWTFTDIESPATLLLVFLLPILFPYLILKKMVNPPNNKYKRVRDALMDYVFDGAYAEVQRMRFGAESENPESWKDSVGHRWTPYGPKPSAVSGEISANQAENYVVAWIQYLGVQDIKPTRYSQDGGIDAESSRYVAQVKHYSSPVTVQPIRELFGVATSQRKESCFFAQSGYTKDAQKFGEENNMALFTYSVATGELHAVTSRAQIALSEGL